MGRNTTQRLRITTVSSRIPRVRELIDDHAARRPWPAWTQRALFVIGGALALIALGAMLGTAFQAPARTVATSGNH